MERYMDLFYVQIIVFIYCYFVFNNYIFYNTTNANLFYWCIFITNFLYKKTIQKSFKIYR